MKFLNCIKLLKCLCSAGRPFHTMQWCMLVWVTSDSLQVLLNRYQVNCSEVRYLLSPEHNSTAYEKSDNDHDVYCINLQIKHRQPIHIYHIQQGYSTSTIYIICQTDSMWHRSSLDDRTDRPPTTSNRHTHGAFKRMIIILKLAQQQQQQQQSVTNAVIDANGW